MRRSIVAALGALALLGSAGCTSTRSDGEPRTIIPSQKLNISPSLTVSAESLVAAGIIYLIVDPMAPNWKVEVEPISPVRYRVGLTMKRFITGGEGESTMVLRRTAEKLRQERGFAEYAILEQREGIESHVLIAQRYAHAVIELR